MTVAKRERDAQLRELTDQAHGANLDLGHALLHNLTSVDPADALALAARRAALALSTGRCERGVGDLCSSRSPPSGRTLKMEPTIEKSAMADLAPGLRLHYVEAGAGPRVVVMD
jgi:hypothetical protein